ncbi:hypothetical protein H4R19_001095 [Coemansia spiralis]|nr:hypothetical protein H4R19_001095 [Coemansia spiralis]
MAADSKHLSWALARLTRDARTRGLLGRAVHGTLPPSIRSWLVARLARITGEPTQLGDARVAPPLGGDAAEHTGASMQPLCTYNGDQMTLAAAAAGRRRPRRGGLDDQPAHTRRRRWVAWRPAASWDFPTLNSSFPFTIPTIPAGIFLIAQPGGHSSIPSGVMMPAGLGTAARKFHSMSLTRQPGVPYDGDEDSGPAFTDPNALSAQLLRADPASQALALQRGIKTAAVAARRSDGAPPGSRPRVTKNYMFAHAATGIPKLDNCIPLPRRAGAAAAAAASASAAGDSDAEEMAASAGEDAFFHRSDAIGIADGVGGWAGVKDADPSLFSRRLMHHVCREVQRYEDIDDELFSHYFDATPVDIMRRAYEFTVDEMKAASKRGSSTACVVVLRGDELRVANLGDCGLTVVRQGDMVYRTEEQQHSFNYPYQLGTEPHSDKPSDAQVFRLKIQKGDVIIVGSDGVFDNLFDEDILEEVSLHLPPAMRAAGEPGLKYSTDSLLYEPPPPSPTAAPATSDGARPRIALPQFHIDPRAISRAIAQRAKLVSEDARYTESPFQLRAMQEGLYYQGGKRDDIAVVVAVVTDLEDTPDRR